MMARQRPRLDADRAASYAWTLLRQGRAEAEVRQILGRSIGGGGDAAVSAAIAGAREMTARAQQVGYAPETDTIGEAAQLPPNAANPVIRIDIVTNAPGRAETVHSVVIDYLPADTTVGELTEALAEIAEEVSSEYGGEGSSFSWSIAYVQ